MSKRSNQSKVIGETYAESHIWSQRHEFWKNFRVKKPRLPNNNEERWITKHIPPSLRLFKGSHNNEICNILRSLGDSFDAHRTFPSSITIHGPSGSGKTSLCTVFLNELCDSLRIEKSKVYQWILKLDGKTMEGSTLTHKIQIFDETELTVVKMQYRIIVIDDADLIPPSSQQAMKAALEDCIGAYRFIFLCRDPHKLIAYFHGKTHPLKTRRISERDALKVILTLCQDESLGYDRHGIKHLFALHKHISLSYIIDHCQDVFLQFHYLSEENIVRFVSMKEGVVHVPEVCSTAAVMPLDRCSLCTLIPPCKHISLSLIGAQGLSRRAALPLQSDGIICPEFYRLGRCSTFNKTGSCRLSHPLNLHNVKPVPRRCPQCTLIWPCQHCSFSLSRTALLQIIRKLKLKFVWLKRLAVPHPPKDVAASLSVDYPDYKDFLLYLKKTYTSSKTYSMLIRIEEWVEDTICIDKSMYISKEMVLQSTFSEMFESPLLANEPDIGSALGSAKDINPIKSESIERENVEEEREEKEREKGEKEVKKKEKGR